MRRSTIYLLSLLVLTCLVALIGCGNTAGEAPVASEISVSTVLGVDSSVKTVCHTAPGKEVYIKLKIDNPDGFAISSLTISGKEYASSSFESGSNLETIVVKIALGSSDGIFEYTLDAIKYIEKDETKSVSPDGKSVTVCVWDDDSVTAAVTRTEVGTNSLSLSVSVADEAGLIAFSGGKLSAVIYEGESAVAEQALAVGDNTVRFDSLKTNAEYRYAIISSRDLGEGAAAQLLCDCSFTTDAVITLTGITPDKAGVSFDYSWHESHAGGSVTALKLYRGDELVAEPDPSAKAITGLLSNSTYRLVLEYKNGERTESIFADFKTVARITPDISLKLEEKTQSSIRFNISETDEDNVGAITKIELIHNGTATVAESTDVRVFENLLSNNAYTIKVTYTYDLSDGEGEHTLTKELSTSTLTRLKPAFTITAGTVTLDSITSEYNYVDKYSVLSSYKVELYRDGVLVLENPDKEIAFSSLDYYTDYIVKISFVYDLGDGAGAQSSSVQRAFKTLPYMGITSAEISNTEAVSVGEVINMKLAVVNPLGMTVESATVNGASYPARMLSGGEVVVDITHADQFPGGATYLSLESVSATIDGTSYVIEPSAELGDSIFVNGRPEISELKFLDSEYQPIDWAFPSDKVYLMVAIDDQTGYTPESVKLSLGNSEAVFDEITELDDGVYCFEVSLSAALNVYKPVSITYSNEHTERTVEYSDAAVSCYCVISDEAKYIDSVEDILAMEKGYYYEMTCELDFSGREWEGIEFEGVFNGAGYSIENMTLKKNVNNSDAYLGLFSRGTGVIENLNIKAASATSELLATGTARHNAYLGGLVALADRLFIHNCTVDADSSFTLTNSAGGYSYVGGLVGKVNEIADAYALTVTGCASSASITVTSTGLNIYLGGMLGYAETGSHLFFEDCENHGALTASTPSYTTYVGGLAGYTNFVTVISSLNTAVIRGATAGGIVALVARNTGRAIVIGCTNSGEIQANTESFTTIGAGIVAEMYGHTSIINCSNTADIYSTTKTGSAITGSLSGYMFVTTIDIIDCFNSGKVTSSRMITTSTAGGLAAHSNGVVTFKNSINCGLVDATTTGGLGGYAHGTLTMENNYSIFTAGTSNYNGIQLTVEQMNDKSFYTDVLGWSEDVWDFSELDIENGKCPTLK